MQQEGSNFFVWWI